MSGHPWDVAETTGGSHPVGDAVLLVPDIQVPSPRPQVLKDDKQGDPGGQKGGAVRRLRRFALPSAILAFITGILLGTQLRPQPVKQDIGVSLPTFGDHEEKQLPPETPPPPPEEEKAELDTTERRDKDVSEPKLLLEDAWGLQSLSQFEQTLSPELKRGREELAALLQTACLSKPEGDVSLKRLERQLAKALSGGQEDKLVGMIVKLTDVSETQTALGKMGTNLPMSVRVKRALSIQYPRVLLEVEDIQSNKIYTMRIPLFSKASISKMQLVGDPPAIFEMFAADDIPLAKQACSGTPATLVAAEKGMLVPLYMGRAARVVKQCLVGGSYLSKHVHLLERVHGEFNFSALIQSGISPRAKEYIAHRLLQIVLKLQQALLSHNDLNWDNLYLNQDGSFVLGGCDNCTPFGKAVGVKFTPSGKTLEPTFRIQQDLYGRKAVPSATSDLWSLGVLLYELFTDGNLPYTDEKSFYSDNALRFSKFLIDKDIQAQCLIPYLDAANCPYRWRSLILALLQPIRGNRITARDIVVQYPDLVHSSPK